MNDRSSVIVTEGVNRLDIPQLDYKRGALAPVISEETVRVHYDILTKNYFKKYNETGDKFQHAGAVLHEFWRANIRPSRDDNKPSGEIEALIKEHFKTFAKFKQQFTEQATTIHGNGWCALKKNGEIIQIPNHKIVSGIVLLLDVWEHSYWSDYGADKTNYVRNWWKIVNWDHANQQL